MPDLLWIKIMLNTFDDEKIKVIDSLPERDAIIVIWLKLLILAGRVNNIGYIYFTEETPYTIETLASVLNRPINTVRLAIETFKNFKMIEMDEKGIYIINFQKYQNIDGMGKIRDQWGKASKKYREKQKQLKLSLPEVKLLTTPKDENTEKSSYDGIMTEYDGHKTTSKSDENSHIASYDNHMTDENQPQKSKPRHMTSYDRHNTDIDKEYISNEGNGLQGLKSLKEMKDFIPTATNKVGYLAKIFLDLHPSCTEDDKKNCYGRIGKLVKVYSNDYEYILTAIYKSQDEMIQIDGSHLNYIEKYLQNKNGTHDKNEPTTRGYECVN